MRLIGPRLSQNWGALLKKEDFFGGDIMGDLLSSILLVY